MNGIAPLNEVGGTIYVTCMHLNAHFAAQQSWIHLQKTHLPCLPFSVLMCWFTKCHLRPDDILTKVRKEQDRWDRFILEVHDPLTVSLPDLALQKVGPWSMPTQCYTHDEYIFPAIICYMIYYEYSIQSAAEYLFYSVYNKFLGDISMCRWCQGSHA